LLITFVFLSRRTKLVMDKLEYIFGTIFNL